jgi:hypothetical protein
MANTPSAGGALLPYQDQELKGNLKVDGNVTVTGTVTSAGGNGPTLTDPTIADGLTASGSVSNDFSGSTGTFKTSTGANTLGGAVTINAATTPSLTTATGKTNTGFIQVNGKTSGALKITTADAMAQTVTVTTAAQTSGAASITIGNLAGTSVGLGLAAATTAFKFATGITALGGTNPTTVASGLTSIVGLALTLDRSTAVSSGTAFVTYHNISGGSFDMYGWVLAGSASTGTENVGWVAIGT